MLRLAKGFSSKSNTAGPIPRGAGNSLQHSLPKPYTALRFFIPKTTKGNPMTTATDDALHAAETWLDRIGADPAAVVVVTIAPAASVGVWQPGARDVGVLAKIDDAAAEVAES